MLRRARAGAYGQAERKGAKGGASCRRRATRGGSGARGEPGLGEPAQPRGARAGARGGLARTLPMG
eukprot:4470917-Alexandrium_andersonii.AAC.1